MNTQLFLPSARQTNWLLIVGFLSIGYALYLRYLVIEQSTVGLACEGGLRTWLCSTRRLAIALFTHSVFGWLALAAAVLNLIRPHLVLLAIGIAAAGFGIVLYNVALSAFAVALLILSLARPVRVEE
jgi:NADH:ubiquinone oxidoreductase subunit K